MWCLHRPASVRPRILSLSGTHISPSVRSALFGLAASAGFAASIVMLVSNSAAQTEDTAARQAISPLINVRPLQADTSEYIRDLDTARQLGKALFWDTQAGSDGTACASCHFHAGADIRIKNQVNPGSNAEDSIFNVRGNASIGGASGPNKIFTAADFPFRRLSNPEDRESIPEFDTNDVFSSQGSSAGDRETCKLNYDAANDPFHANGLIYRRVEPRHAPSVINAAFYYRQYWDGRANNQFNGVDSFGSRTYTFPFDDPNSPGSRIGNPNAAGTGILMQSPTADKGLELVKPIISNSSLASQAVGAQLNDYDMSCLNKSFGDLGRKLLPLKPLSTQVTSPTDSLFSKTNGLVNLMPVAGLNTSYAAMVEKAFNPKYWAAAGTYSVDPVSGSVFKDPANGYTQMQHNFSLFWGLAIQAYEQMLVSDDTPFDRGPAAMSPEALAGMDVFTGKGKCVACHNGPLFSGATLTSANGSDPKTIEGMLMGDGYPALYDKGFHNTGVRPTTEDIGVGATDPYGFSLSFSRQYKWRLLGQGSKAPDHFDPKPCSLETQVFPDCYNLRANSDPAVVPRDAVDGAFKVPILRNVGLNPPYFHNGGQATLRDVVLFYNRGGDRRGPLGKDTTGLDMTTPFGAKNASNLSEGVGNADHPTTNNGLGLTAKEMDDLVQFLLSLTDQRVACHAGIFDHPELPLVIGHKDIAKSGTQIAKDVVATLPAVGQKGLPTCFPNSGDLFGTLNLGDSRRLQDVFGQVLR
jgi:cytochrome c peroxidase